LTEEISNRLRQLKNKKVLIAGIGNKLLGDDGFGPAVIELLEDRKLPPHVEVRDFGSATVTIASELSGYDAAIFIDAVKRGGKAGTLHRTEVTGIKSLTAEDVNNLARLSVHEVGLEELLAFAKAINSLPSKVFIIGCEPEKVEPRIELTDKVRKAAEKAADLILRIFADDCLNSQV